MANSKIPAVLLSDTLNLQRRRFNQLVDSVGDVSALNTTANNITAAINELDSDLETRAKNALSAGEGLDYDSATGTFSGEDASTTNKGVASFATADFTTSSGAVSIKTGGVSNTQLAGSIPNTKLANSSITLITSENGVGQTVALGGSLTLDIVDSDLIASAISTSLITGKLSTALNTTHFDSAALVTVAEGLASSNNDTSIPTTAAVKDYIDSAVFIAGAYGDGSVDTHLNQSNPTGGYVLSWSGTDYEWIESIDSAEAINLINTAYVQARQGNIDTTDFAAAALVTEAEGITSNDNDTTIPTSAAVKDYIDSAIVAAGAYGDGAVDTHLNQSNPTGGYVLSWSGTDYEWIESGTGSIDSAQALVLINANALDSAEAINLINTAYVQARQGNIDTTDFAAAALVTEAEGITSNDNDTTIPTSAAVKDYVDNSAGGVSGINDLTDGFNDNTSVGLGTSALANDNGANANVGIGTHALCGNVAGIHNVGIGFCSLQATTGSCNTAVGSGTLFVNTSGADNTAFGTFALCSNTTASENTAIGYLAMASNTIGNLNTALGGRALMANTTGSCNVAIGGSALAANTTGKCNVAVGKSALLNNTSGFGQVSIGAFAACSSTEGPYNIAIGQCALRDNTVGHTNIAVGRAAMHCSDSGSNNIAIGCYALFSNCAGYKNVVIGDKAADELTIGGFNTIVGTSAAQGLISGLCNIFVGFLAGPGTGCSASDAGCNIGIGCGALGGAEGTVCHNIAIGDNAGRNIQQGNQNITIGQNAGAWLQGHCTIAIGSCALYQNVSGCWNIAIGASALRCLGVTGSDGLTPTCPGHRNTAIGFESQQCVRHSDNTSLGYRALYQDSAGSDNVSIGSCSSYNNRSGYGLTAVGSCSMHSNTTGLWNTAVGLWAMRGNITGSHNVAVGKSAMWGNTGSYNTALGSSALPAAALSSQNVAVGFTSMWTNTSGDYNVAVGSAAMYCNMAGDRNTGLGASALGGFIDGDYNTAVGNMAGLQLDSGDNNIIIGYNAQASATNVSNEATIGDANITKLRIPGVGGLILEDVDASSFKLYTNDGATLNTTWDSDNMIVQGNVTALSDIRFKENVRTIDGGLSLVDQLRGVRYNKKGSAVDQIGVIAQEMEEVLPEVVITDGDGVKSVAYGNIVGVLIEAIKELKAEIDQLKAGN